MRLEIETEDGVRRTEELTAPGRYLAGRDASCAIVLEDRAVSRRHCWIDFDGARAFVEDAGSRSGTSVDGWKIDGRTALHDGCELLLGGTIVLVRDVAEPETGSVSAAAAVAKPSSPAPAPALAAAPSPVAPAGAAVAPPPQNGNGGYERNSALFSEESIDLQAKIHAIVLQRANAEGIAGDFASDGELAARAGDILDRVLRERRHEIPDGVGFEEFRQTLVDELLGYGPVSPMLRDPEVTEIMVNGPDRIFVERRGLLHETGARFANEGHLVQVIKRIVEPIGRHVDDASPMVDARLPDGSRVNAVVPPLALDGASLTIRKFAEKKLSADDLVRFGSLTPGMADFLREAVRERMNILVSGGTGSGKTTLLNILSQFIPESERLVTIEDSAELKLSHRNIVRLEARPANIEGKGRIAIRDLVINALRMRPDRIIVGECRGAEALDMLQAMNTGHDGSLTTAHANSPRDALSRLENMVMMAGYDLPVAAIREQVASAIDLIVQEARLRDGTRKIVKIVEVTGREGDVIQMQDIFVWNQTGTGEDGSVEGYFTATGNVPYFVEEIKRQGGGATLDMNMFVPTPGGTR